MFEASSFRADAHQDMKVTEFECTVCLDAKHEVQPRSIEDSLICTDCVKDGILPIFKLALEHEHHYPPKWGSTVLYWLDFDDELNEHFGKDFPVCYIRRRDEYESPMRVYCKHKISARQALGPGEKLPNHNVRLALGPAMIEVCKSAGHEMVECGGFLSNAVQPPNTIVECWRCGGEVCAACEMVMHSPKDREHYCDVMNRADNLQGELGQRRGRDIQQCPNMECRNIIALQDGCNHMTCNKCETQFCFICGEPATPMSGHWILGSRCPRWNHPDDQAAQYDDEVGDDDEAEGPPVIDLDGAEWEPVMTQLRYLVMLRIENGIRFDQEWLFRVLQTLYPENETDMTLELVAVMFMPLAEIEPRPPLVPGVFVSIDSQRGRDEVAMRLAEWITVQGRRPIPREWWSNLVRDLEQRDIEPNLDGFVTINAADSWALSAELDDFIVNNIITSFTLGLFDIHTHNAEPEIAAWALRSGLRMDDDSVTNLLRLYDDLSANLELVDLAVPSADQVQDFRERHRSIEVAVQSMERDYPGVIVRFMHHINESLGGYADRIPDWSGMNPGLLALEQPEGFGE